MAGDGVSQDDTEAQLEALPIGAVKLSQREPSDFKSVNLQDLITKEVLKLLKLSLFFTFSFAALLFAIDSAFIGAGIIKPAERLLTSTAVLAFVTATVVQVGTAFAAIVVAVFKTSGDR